MSLTGFHLRVAQMALGALGQEDFALGGGYALQAHGILDRPSDDLDAYTPVMEVPTFERAEELILAAAAGDGLEAEVGKSDSYFRQVFVRDPSTGETVVVDLGYDLRTEAAVTISGVGNVIALDDAVGSKARALNDRRAARDYVDLDRVLQRPDWDAARLWDVFSRFRLAEREDFAADLRAGHEQDPDDYLAYGLSLDEMDAMFERFDKAAQLILAPPERSLTASSETPQEPQQSSRGSAVPQDRCGKPRTNGKGFCMRRVGEHGCPYHG